MEYRIVVTRRAADDLHALFRYVAREREREIAHRLVLKLKAYPLVLADFPQLGRIVPEFGDAHLRELIHASYRIIYRVRPEFSRIEILRFWHAARGLLQF